MRSIIEARLSAAPDTLKQFVQEQVREKGFGTASEYVRDVLRKQYEHRVRDGIDTCLSAALQTPAEPVTDRSIRQDGLKRSQTLPRHS